MQLILKTVGKVESWMARMPGLRWLLPSAVVESVARCAASIGSVVGRSSFGIERRVRGYLSSSRFRATGLQLDRRLQLESPQHLVLGDDVTLYGGSHYVAGGSGKIEIGSQTHIGRNCVLSGLGGIRIGKGCAISSHVSIYSVSNHFRDQPLQPIINNTEHRQVIVGDDVWIGAGASILPGVKIGDHAVIGAGAVVNRDVAAWQVAVGVPARVVKDRRETQSPRINEAA